MNDTSEDITQKISKMMQKKSPIERLKMGQSMYETSKYLVSCSIKNSNPNISKSDFRKELFIRFYGSDFDQKTREKIINHIEQSSLE